MKAQLYSAEKEIAEIESIISESKSMDTGINLLQEEYRVLNRKFPQAEEDALKALSETARTLKIELVSVRSQPKAALLDAENKGLIMDNLACQKVACSIEMRCAYKELAKYLSLLRESVPAFLVIDGLKVIKDDAGASRLNIIINISAYIFTPLKP